MRRSLVLFLLLAACGTPQERCIARETRDVRILDRLIVESETNLKRGYALEEVTVRSYEWVRCSHQDRPRPVEGEPPPPPRPPEMCFEDVAKTVTRPKSIDLGAESEKLASMRAKRTQLLRAAQPGIAQCKAENPQ